MGDRLSLFIKFQNIQVTEHPLKLERGHFRPYTMDSELMKQAQKGCSLNMKINSRKDLSLWTTDLEGALSCIVTANTH